MRERESERERECVRERVRDQNIIIKLKDKNKKWEGTKIVT